MLTSNRRHATYSPTPPPLRPRRLPPHRPIPRPTHPRRRPGDPPVCVTKSTTVPATQAQKRTYIRTKYSSSSAILRHNAPRPGPRHARRPLSVAVGRFPSSLKQPPLAFPFESVDRCTPQSAEVCMDSVCVTKSAPVRANKSKTRAYMHTRYSSSAPALRHNAPRPGQRHARRLLSVAPGRFPSSLKHPAVAFARASV